MRRPRFALEPLPLSRDTAAVHLRGYHMQNIWVRAFFIWLLFAVIAVALGAGRQMLLAPLIGDLPARWVGTLLGCAIFTAIIAWFLRGSGLSFAAALGLGCFWVVLTIAFEFGFGHYVMGQPFELLIADYNLFAGRPWVLVLISLLVAPLAVPRGK